MPHPVPSDKQPVDDLTQEFLLESSEGLDRMERCLTALEQTPGDAGLLAEVFRVVHTIKGSTGFLAFPRLEKISHAGEHLLSLLRDNRLQLARPVFDGLLALLDALRALLRHIAASGEEGTPTPGADDALLARIASLAQPALSTAAPAASDLFPAQPTTEAADPLAPRDLADNTLRVEVDTLNQMMNLVGELVLTRNQIVLSAQDESSRRLAQRLDSVTADLRESMVRARTQPIGALFQRFPRLVRDLSDRLGKCVRLEMTGLETRLDKTLLEALKDPLLHTLRNAIDHGIEPPAERVRRGKALEAALRIAAYHEGGQMVVEVSDDGCGIDPDRVRQRAVAKGLISAQRAAAMSDAEAQMLIFAAGFSTRDEVTVTSGRGVGMDVVRANVESVGGVVEIDSTPGSGMRLRMRVPLTLAILPALVVRSGNTVFALPRNAVGELLVVPREDEHRMIERMGDAMLLRVRGEMVPLISLCDLLGLPPQIERGYYVALLEVAGNRFGIIVDDLGDPQEIVVKPLARVLRVHGLFSGATLLGNGELAFILDVGGLVRLARVAPTADSSVDPQRPQQFGMHLARSTPAAADMASLLIYEDGFGQRMALPLAQVERVENLAVASVERCGTAMMFRAPSGLVHLEDAAGLLASGAETVNIILCQRPSDHLPHVAIVVRAVLDIAQSHISAEDGMEVAHLHEGLALVRASPQPRAAAVQEWRAAA